MVLDKLWFRGQLRSLTGPFRGEGAFVSSGEIHGYRIAAGRLADDGIKVKLNIDIAEWPLAIEVDGLLAADRTAPGFDGSFSMSRPVGSVKASGKTVVNELWKLTGKMKANAQSALMEQVEFQYGPEQRGAKLDGAAEIKFGERPRLQGALSARQIDLDRLIATSDAPRRLPAAATQALAELFSGMMRPSIPVSLAVSIDAVTIGGAVLQAFGSDLRSDGAAWRLDRLDFRAPGFTKVSVSGRLDPSAKGIGFAGSASVDANDPKALIAWLAGQPVAAGQVLLKPWQLRGDVTLSTDGIAVEQLRSEFDRGVVEGKLAYAWPAAGQPAKLNADLQAGEIDFDALLAFADGAFTGLGLEWPRDIALGLKVGRTRIAGFEARNAAARLKLDAGGIQIERLSVADFGNAAFEAKGRIETTATPGGSIAVDLDARELNAVIALADRFTPMLAEPLRRMARPDSTAKLRATVSLEHEAGSAAAKFAVNGRVGAVRLDVAAHAAGKPELFSVTDLGALAAADTRFEGRFEAEDGARVLALIGLDRLAALEAVTKGPARLSVNTSGPLNREVRIDGRLTAGAIDAQGKGTLWLPAGAAATVKLDQVSGTIAGRKVQGRLAVRYGDEPRVDGVVEVDTVDAAAVVAAAIGMRAGSGINATEPFAASRSDVAGRITFKAERASLSPMLQARALHGAVRFGPSEVVFDELTAELANGRLDVRLAFVTETDGASVRANITLNNADAATIVGGGVQRPPVAGKVTLRTELEASGRSPAAFIGSLAGTGTISLEHAQFASLNPRVFDAVIRAVDLGVPTEPGRIRDFVATALENGTLPAAHAEAAITIAAGQARLSHVIARTSGADLSAAANVDLVDGSLDAVLTLAGTPSQVGGPRPTLSIALKGPWHAPSRTIDANALASWLALRAVEQQAKQVDLMEQQRERLLREANVPPLEAVPVPSPAAVAPAPGGDATSALPGAAAPPLPPAINVRPTPKPSAAPRVEGAPAPRAAAPTPAPPVNPKPPVGPPLNLLGAQN